MQPVWIEVREQHTGKLLFRYDPVRHLVEVVIRQKQTITDLSKLEQDWQESLKP